MDEEEYHLQSKFYYPEDLETSEAGIMRKPSDRKCVFINRQVCSECHIINYLLTELTRAVLGNIGPRSFLYGPRVLPRPRYNIPQYGPRARLISNRGEFNKTIIPFTLVGYEIGYSQLGASRLVGYLPSHIQRALME